MTQLSEEQQERVRQIRRRHEDRRGLGTSLPYGSDWQDADYILSLLDSDRQAAGIATHEWFSDWPTINGFYWLRGWRHYGDLPINVDGDSFWMMFNLTRSHRTDLNDSEDVQFLGPITPYTAITAATDMRDKCVETVRAMGLRCGLCPHGDPPNADGSCSAYGYNGVDCQAQPCVCRHHSPTVQYHTKLIKALESLTLDQVKPGEM